MLSGVLHEKAEAGAGELRKAQRLPCRACGTGPSQHRLMASESVGPDSLCASMCRVQGVYECAENVFMAYGWPMEQNHLGMSLDLYEGGLFAHHRVLKSIWN